MRNRFVRFGLAVACLSACSGSGPSAPFESSGSSDPRFITLYGPVLEHTSAGPRPLANFTFRLIRTGPNPIVIPVTTDSEGRYSVSLPAQTAFRFAIPAGTSLLAPCAGDPVSISRTAWQGRQYADFNLVSPTLLASEGSPASMPLEPVFASGRVTDERTGEPLAGVSVSWDPRDEGGNATTLTDRQGRYMLCGDGGGGYAPMTVLASMAGYGHGTRTFIWESADPRRIDLTLTSW